MDAFNTKLTTVRALLNTDFEEDVKGKNYYIPLYQRSYAWSYEEAEKLVRDIKDMIDLKEESEYQPYFIGGVVLSEQSILGIERSNRSLEVIDGQQRLTTLVIIVSCLIHYMKNQIDSFERKEAIKFLIEEMRTLIHTSILNKTNYRIEEIYKVERSDNLKEIYETIINKLLNDNILDFSELDELGKTDYEENFINIVKKIYENVESLEEDELFNFIEQMLTHTHVVITTTISTETGFLIFEKLNDSGITLEPQDLLKNYIFSTTDEEEYETLTIEWQKFLAIVESINTTKAQIPTRDFLEQYLTIVGNYLKITPKTKKKEKIYDKFKEITCKYNNSLELLDDLKDIAREYKKLKRTYIAAFLNTINFKLAYQVFLSFYKKFGNSYILIQPEILILMLRLGLVYLIIGQSKDLSKLIPQICEEIINAKGSKEETLNYITTEIIDKMITKKEELFYDVIVGSNLFRKKPLCIMLFKILNFHFEKNALDFNLEIRHIMPQELDKIIQGNYSNIDKENYTNYTNLIGNLTILDKSIDIEKIPLNFNVDKNLFFTDKTNAVTNLISNEDNTNNEFVKIYKSYINPNKIWGRDSILERSQAIAKVLLQIIIVNKFDKAFLNNSIKINNIYYIKRAKDVDATMEIVENGYKVYKGSKCTMKQPHKNYGWHKKRNELINNGILEENNNSLIFTEDYIFNSPSEAASIILAKQSPGPKDWKNEFNIPLRESL